MSIPAESLLVLFERMLSEHWAYDNNVIEEGTVDCSGAFVWAYRQFGKSLYHGSNRIARTKVIQLLPAGSVTAKPCMAAFKIRQSGEKYYNLPSCYKPGGAYDTGDLKDYFHIGLVARDGTHVLNAQGKDTGFVSSKLSAGWDYLAYLSDVDYGEGLIVVSIETAKVVGGKLNMRATPSKDGTYLCGIPEGSTVTVLDKTNESYWNISYNGKTGYAAAQYLSGSGGTATTDSVSVVLSKDTATALKAALTAAGV